MINLTEFYYKTNFFLLRKTFFSCFLFSIAKMFWNSEVKCTFPIWTPELLCAWLPGREESSVSTGVEKGSPPWQSMTAVWHAQREKNYVISLSVDHRERLTLPFSIHEEITIINCLNDNWKNLQRSCLNENLNVFTRTDVEKSHHIVVEDLGPVAPSMVSVNHGLRGHSIEPCTFLW